MLASVGAIYAQGTAPTNYDRSIQNSIKGIERVVGNDLVDQRGEDAVNTLIFRVINAIVIPLVIFMGIFLALIGFYRLFVSNNPDDIQTGFNYIIWGIVGIVVMVSARYIGFVIWNDIFDAGTNTRLNGVEIADQIYSQVLYPFLKLGIYLVIGVLFLVVIVKSYKFVTNDEDTNTQTTINAIIGNILGILLILGSKEIVEAVYGRRDAIKTQFANVSEIGGALLAGRANIPIYFQFINWLIGLIVVAILVFLLIQGFKLLFNPESDESIDETKKYLLYATLGVFVIGACYVIVNALIVSGTKPL
ncbi:MAG: hypothetical protein NZL83_02305 [Candidatus Absconditabacterales bacterium]|nr:hypothetical protein [Candidatus Absconditabacterales bacterium]